MRPWLALATVWLLFELPTIFEPSRVVLSRLRPSGEILVLLTLGAASYAVAWGQRVRVALWTVAACLVLVRVDALIFRLILNDTALLYDQIFMIRHTFVLIGDLWSLTTLAVLLGAVLVIGLLVLATRRLFRAMRVLIKPERLGFTAQVGFVLWLIALPASGTHVMGLTSAPLMRWEALPLAENIQRSRSIYRAIRKTLKAPPYADLKQTKLVKKPDVFLILVESYGRIMATHEGMMRGHGRVLRQMEEMISPAGWHGVSAYSRAPITGGRSWLAEGSVIMGTTIKYESVFQHLVSQSSKLNTFTSFFHDQGYDTLLVVPADRRRPGVEVVNRYGFGDVVHFDSFKYAGPHIGWGIVPDQFSMDFVDENYLMPADKPVFMDFHMVSSHAPWRQVPELVDDYRDLVRLPGQRELLDHTKHAARAMLNTAQGFNRGDRGVRNYMGELTDELRRRYTKSIHYSLEVVARFLARRERDALVIVMGDHQPPVISPNTERFDVPVMVFSKTPEMLEEFKQVGFIDGLLPADVKVPPVSHGGLLTLVARSLARTGGDGGPLPEVFPQGVNIVK
jgi:hypothetical protein